MRLTSLICRVFLFGSFILAQKYNRLDFAARLIDEQLYFFEMMLDTYQKFDFSPDISSLIENKDQLPEDQRQKRISLHGRCVRKARDGFLNTTKRNNALIGNIFQIFFSAGDDRVKYQSEMGKKFAEAMRITMDMKQFIYHEMPLYYNELGKNMSIDFTEEEIKRNEKMINDAREESKKDIFRILEQMGTSERP